MRSLWLLTPPPLLCCCNGHADDDDDVEYYFSSYSYSGSGSYTYAHSNSYRCCGYCGSPQLACTGTPEGQPPDILNRKCSYPKNERRPAGCNSGSDEACGFRGVRV